ncbi:GNAT family N-acetyltransferase [Streptomyces kunmingensis]|uniref:GNAT family N-acetyltransferase n=1 Tax=Streptomyces kunmingensis TaxID=68225 RepID=A0ABU6CBH8_9ACTN|nr:GNAT family N-acetyltransferase [Streptomyces kunmingensis]MEB3962008.1 GNAT family N-acetyltransferase [Streptomyces kunmingensis]
MPEPRSWPRAVPLDSARLWLEPLSVEHAPEAAGVFGDVRLHTWIGGAPPTPDELEARYRRQVVGHSPDGQHGWLNWLLRDRGTRRLVGTVQATLHRPHPDRVEAELAWVVGHAFQGAGYGKEGAVAMAGWLRTQGVVRCVAHVSPGHRASEGIAAALGMTPTGEVHDSEMLWADSGS